MARAGPRLRHDRPFWGAARSCGRSYAGTARMTRVARGVETGACVRYRQLIGRQNASNPRRKGRKHCPGKPVVTMVDTHPRVAAVLGGFPIHAIIALMTRGRLPCKEE